MSSRRAIWVLLALVVVGAVSFAVVVLGGVHSPPSTSAPEAASGAQAAASTTSSAPAAAPLASSASTTLGTTLTRATASAPAPSHAAAAATRPGSAASPGSPAKVVKPKPSGPLLKDRVTFAKAITFVPAGSLTAPQTYVAEIVPQGWTDKASGDLLARVVSARLAGPIDAATGQETGPPASGTPDHSKQFVGATVIAATSTQVRADLTHKQKYKVHIVLLPSGGGGVFIVDRLG